MLADAGFLIAELIEPAQRLKVPVVTLFQPTLRRMRRHREISKFHGGFISLVLDSYDASWRARERKYLPRLRLNCDETHLLVIASAAKQSMKPQRKSGLLRRFAPRNDTRPSARAEFGFAEQRLLGRGVRAPVLRRSGYLATKVGGRGPPPPPPAPHCALPPLPSCHCRRRWGLKPVC